MTLVKICGITTWEDAKMAVDSGADMLGFVCSDNSPRRIDPELFQEIATRLPPSVRRVGVFDRAIHPSWRFASRTAFDLFHRIQYYHDSAWTEVIRENWDMGRKIRAFHITKPADLREIAHCNDLVQSYLLNVHPDPGAFAIESEGWDLARQVHQFGKNLYLAGGLTPENVAKAIRLVRPYCVDVTVGVESYPGKKDLEKLRALLKAVRQGDQ